MRTYVGHQQAVSAEDFVELALGTPVELWLGVEGETMPSWLGALPEVAAVRPGAGFAEVELPEGVEPAAILAAALTRGAVVTRFEIAEPSLEAIFIERVGRPAGDEATLGDDETGAVDDSASDSMVEGAA